MLTIRTERMMQDAKRLIDRAIDFPVECDVETSESLYHLAKLIRADVSEQRAKLTREDAAAVLAAEGKRKISFDAPAEVVIVWEAVKEKKCGYTSH